jgi:uncharacterized protein YndB with AHSA1/START domain
MGGALTAGPGFGMLKRLCLREPTEWAGRATKGAILMTELRCVEVSREIKASPEDVFRALTHPLDLSFWFCHTAWTDPQSGGEFQVRWRNGWWARGVYEMVERPRRVALTWQGKDEPGETDVVFEITATEGGTSVKLTHSGFGDDALWDKAVLEAESSWLPALENLDSVLTTGVDLREANRPVLGVLPAPLTPERAASENITTSRGIYLSTVLPDGGAAAAGLKRGDVITHIGGMAITDDASLTTTLGAYRAGDRVQVGYVRGTRSGIVSIDLRVRPTEEIPSSPEQAVERARALRGELIAELRTLVSGLTEEQANRRPAAHAWSVSETLAHLSVSERFFQRWCADIIVGNTRGQVDANPTATPELLATALGANPTAEALVDRLEREIEETHALYAALRPEVVAMKARYRLLVVALLSDLHLRDHIEQIRAAAAAG